MVSVLLGILGTVTVSDKRDELMFSDSSMLVIVLSFVHLAGICFHLVIVWYS
jgi:hypothetical protein